MGALAGHAVAGTVCTSARAHAAARQTAVSDTRHTALRQLDVLPFIDVSWGEFLCAVRRPPLRWSLLSPALCTYLMVLVLFGFAVASEAFIMLRGHERGMPVVTLLLWAWLAALQSITALAGAPVTDRLSKRSLTLMNWVSLAVGYAAPAFASTAMGLWIAVSSDGILSRIGEGVEHALVSELADSWTKGTAFGLHHIVTAWPRFRPARCLGGSGSTPVLQPRST